MKVRTVTPLEIRGRVVIRVIGEMTTAGNARFLDRAGEYAGFIYFIIIF